MRRSCWLAGLALAALVVSACGANAEPAIVAFVPSATPTATATLTPTASATPTSAPTRAASPAASTRPPTTPTPGPSPTRPLAATVTDAPATLTATFAPTLAGLRVEYFTTDARATAPGDNLTLYWSIKGASRVRVYRVDEDGERLWRWDVNPEGSLTVSTGAEDRDVARFVLEGEAGEATVEQPLLIPLECGQVWFFDPPPAACPAALPQYTLQAEQTFERGRMIWVQAQDRIYVVFDDGGTPSWAQYPDNFAEGDPEQDGSLVPPEGLQQPVRGFGLVWRGTPRVRERLGWAVSPEVGFDGAIQATSAELSVATLYLRTRDGGILGLNARDDEWEYLP